ncbi:MAG: hypothetical protein ACU83U_01785 [Gammaproteobacteria bacterium]
MIKHLQSATKGSCFKAAAIACALTACAPSLEKKQALLDTASIKRIEFKIGSIQPVSLKSTMAQPEMKSRVSQNLIDWGYPIGAEDGQQFSHTLVSEIGLIERSNTPTGFSFSSGNSDPRAIDFQKSSVLPISCELASIALPEQNRYLHMSFIADNSIATDKLVDHISTVCFNLLSELKWPETMQNQPSSSFKPNWIPEVRIETVTEPLADGKTNIPGQAVIESSEGRKQIIIHNQGSPLILKFGHDRL